MPLTKRTTFTFNHVDQQDDVYKYYDTNVLKAKYDSRAEDVNNTLSAVIDVLKGITDGDSGADNIGVTPIATSPNKLQGMIEWLYSQIQQTTLGQVADGSITDVKLSDGASDIKTRFSNHLTAYNNHITDFNAKYESMNLRRIGGAY